MTVPMTRQSRAHQFLRLLQERYDPYGSEDGTYFDTYNGNVKRSIAKLERDGYVVSWIDADDPARTWVAVKPNA